jgi:hypothetical protein
MTDPLEASTQTATLSKDSADGGRAIQAKSPTNCQGQRRLELNRSDGV